MEYWEFLLQKEGDRSWLPLESPDVEILEGRYRVVARSSQVNSPVEIRVSHHPAGMPKRWLRSRSTQTNRDGLVVVIPFTRLQPGDWELRCRGDLMADMMGEGWQYAVHLQVVEEAETEWNPDWQNTPDAHLNAHSDAHSDLPNASSDAHSDTQTAQTTAEHSLQEHSLQEHSLQEHSLQEHLLETAIVADQTLVTEQMLPAANLSKSELTEQPVVEPIAASLASPCEPAETVWAAEIAASIEAPDPETAIDPAIAELLSSSDGPPLARVAEQLSEQLVASIFEEFDQTTDEILGASTASVSDVAAAAASDSPFRLTVERSAYVVRRGQALHLKGQIDSLISQASDVTDFSGEIFSGEIFSGEIGICLRDPQRSLVLAEARHVLANHRLLLPFNCTITIPVAQTHLLLGELTLYSAAGDAVAAHSFTVTTDLDELLETIADEFTASDLLQPPLEFADQPVDLNLAFLNLVTAQPSQSQPLPQFQPSLQPSLPPQLYQPDPNRPRSKSLQLPFVNPPLAKAAVESAEVVTPAPEVMPEPAEAAVVAEGAAVEESVAEGLVAEGLVAEGSANEAAVASSPLMATDPADLPLEWQDDLQWRGQLVHSPVHPPATPEDAAFRSLNLQQRFWSRLNAMASDAELSNWLRSAIEPTQVGREQASGGVDALLAAQEIVVEDDLSPEADKSNRSEAIAPPDSLILPQDDPIPSPRLEIPSGELIAGKQIYIRVKLPNLIPRIYVKLWLSDRQTRSLLDGPRWLVDFLPTGLGLEARIPISVPFGCLEVQFEAIAVEMATQRESDKVSVDRLIVPADLPVLSLDELDI